MNPAAVSITKFYSARTQSPKSPRLAILLLALLLMGCGLDRPPISSPGPRVIPLSATPAPATQQASPSPTVTGTPTPLATTPAPPTPRRVTVSRVSAEIDPRLVTPIAPGTRLPDLQLTDIEGRRLNLRDYAAQGRALVLNFWTVGCGSCFYEYPLLQDFYAYHGQEVLEVIGINIAELPEEAGLIAEQMGADFPQVIDSGAEFFTTYFNGAVVPTTIFISPAGEVVQVVTGPMDAYNLDLWLQALGLPHREDL